VFLCPQLTTSGQGQGQALLSGCCTTKVSARAGQYIQYELYDAVVNVNPMWCWCCVGGGWCGSTDECFLRYGLPSPHHSSLLYI
jgi:hypothetical protein